MGSAPYRLGLLGLPVIEGVADLALATHLSAGLLYRLSTCADGFYARFTVPKPGGGSPREIRSPSARLKAVQAWVLRNILDKTSVHPAATAFRRGQGIRGNVTPHVENRYFLCLDVEDFFPSIRYGQVWTVFRTLGYNAHVSHILASLCTCDRVLPQGGVTSPALSNIVCIRLDRRLAGYCGKRNVVYTRYADDLTFSAMSPRALCRLRPVARRILRDEGFALNERKTRVMGPRTCRKVTGLVVSDDGEAGVGRQRKRILRASIHKLCDPYSGLSSDERTLLSAHVDGWLAFLSCVDAKGASQLRGYRASEEAGVPGTSEA